MIQASLWLENLVGRFSILKNASAPEKIFAPALLLMTLMNSTPTKNHSPLNAFAEQANGALKPQPRYSTTPTSRNGAGFHRTDKPTDGDGQWLLVPGAKLPPRAFEVHPKERQRFHLLARTLPLDGNPIAEVENIGRNIFTATYGAEQRRFEAEIAVGQLEVIRLAADHGRLNADLEHVRSTIETEPKPQMPEWFSTKWWIFVFCALCFCLSAAGAISNIVCRLLPETQAFWPAVSVSVVWVLLAVAAKIGIRSVRSPVREILHWSIAAIGLCGAVVWLIGLVTGYAMEVNLDNLASSEVLARSKVAPFVGQLLAEFAVGYACLTGLLSLIQHPRQTIPNPDRTVLSEHLAELNVQTGKVRKELQNPEGNLTELDASRESFVAEGVGIVRARIQAGVATVARLADLQRQEEESNRLLAQFTA